MTVAPSPAMFLTAALSEVDGGGTVGVVVFPGGDTLPVPVGVMVAITTVVVSTGVSTMTVVVSTTVVVSSGVTVVVSATGVEVVSATGVEVVSATGVEVVSGVSGVGTSISTPNDLHSAVAAPIAVAASALEHDEAIHPLARSMNALDSQAHLKSAELAHPDLGRLLRRHGLAHSGRSS